jgi:hypothetical protein
LFGCSNSFEGYQTYYPFTRDTDWSSFKSGSDITLHIKVIPEKKVVHIVWDGFGNEKYMEWRIWNGEIRGESYNYLHQGQECLIKDEFNIECSEISSNTHPWIFQMVNGEIKKSTMITREGPEYSFSKNSMKYYISKWFGVHYKNIE